MRAFIVSIFGLTLTGFFAQAVASDLGEGSQFPDPKGPFGIKTPYKAYDEASDYEKVPEGFTLFYAQTLSRHGAQAVSTFDAGYAQIAKEIWDKANQQGALTGLGKSLGAQIDNFIKVNQKIGHDNLSKLGADESFQTGLRTAKRLKSLIEASITEKRRILVDYSGHQNALLSAKMFLTGMNAGLYPESLIPLEPIPVKNEKQLSFYEFDKDYQDYIAHDPTLNSTLDALYNDQANHHFAKVLLERIYQPTFVEQLINQEITIPSPEGHPKAYNEVDVALALFHLYADSQALADELGHRYCHFEQYFTKNQADWFGGYLDAQIFYTKGPSFVGVDKTYKMAKVLAMDFFEELDKVANGDISNGIKLRFAQAETLIPFAAFLQLEGSEFGVLPSVQFQYKDNPWRGEWVSPYAATIEWDAYKNSQGQVYVKMLYNEKESHFAPSCKPISDKSYYYDLSELAGCYFPLLQ